MIRLLRASALILAAVLALVLAGCTRTVTVTYKYRSLVGLYWVCTGPSALPCGKYTTWRVSKAEYDQIVVGRSYRI